MASVVSVKIAGFMPSSEMMPTCVTSLPVPDVVGTRMILGLLIHQNGRGFRQVHAAAAADRHEAVHTGFLRHRSALVHQ